MKAAERGMPSDLGEILAFQGALMLCACELAQEVLEDYTAGHLTRREATLKLNRIGLVNFKTIRDQRQRMQQSAA